MLTDAPAQRSTLDRRLSALLAPAALGLGLVVAAAPAAAGGGVNWSVNVQLPPVGVVVGSRPHYGPPPAVVYAPPPTIYVPAPPVVYAPPPRVVYAPAPRVVYAPVVVGYGHQARHPYGQGRGHWKDRDRDGIPDRWERRPGWSGSPYQHGPSYGPPPGVVYRGW